MIMKIIEDHCKAVVLRSPRQKDLNEGDDDDAKDDYDENKWMDKRRLKALIRHSLIDLSHNIFRFYHHDHRFKLNRQYFLFLL